MKTKRLDVDHVVAPALGDTIKDYSEQRMAVHYVNALIQISHRATPLPTHKWIWLTAAGATLFFFGNLANNYKIFLWHELPSLDHLLHPAPPFLCL